MTVQANGTPAGSPKCTEFVALSVRRTGYIDKQTLQGALRAVFDQEGLEFGIEVQHTPLGRLALTKLMLLRRKGKGAGHSGTPEYRLGK